MEFLVHLIRVPARLIDNQQNELAVNCRYVEGRWWIFEGDAEALVTPVRILADGITTGLHVDDVPPGQPIIDHAVDIFGLPSWPPPAGWEQ